MCFFIRYFHAIFEALIQLFVKLRLFDIQQVSTESLHCLLYFSLKISTMLITKVMVVLVSTIFT